MLKKFTNFFKSKGNFTDSDMVTFSIGASLLFVGFLVIFDPLKIDDPLLLCLGIFALLIGIASSMKNKSLRHFLIFVSIIVPFLTYFILIRFNFDLSGANNGVSFLAIGYSVFMLPFSRTNQEKEQDELDRLNGIIQNQESEMTTRLNIAKEDSNKRIEEITMQKDERIAELIEEKEARIREVIEEKDAQIDLIKNNETLRVETLQEVIEEKDSQINKIKKDEILRFETLQKDFETLKVQERNKFLTLVRQHDEEKEIFKQRLGYLEKKIGDLKSENRKLQSEKINIQKKNLTNRLLNLPKEKDSNLGGKYLQNLYPNGQSKNVIKKNNLLGSNIIGSNNGLDLSRNKSLLGSGVIGSNNGLDLSRNKSLLGSNIIGSNKLSNLTQNSISSNNSSHFEKANNLSRLNKNNDFLKKL